MVNMPSTLLRTSVLLGLALVACKPDIEGSASVIDSPRVLAIKSEPAETAPKSATPATVTWSALYVGPDGDEDPAKLDWGLCIQRKPLAAAGEISPACLIPLDEDPDGLSLIPLGGGASVMALLPDDGCRQFGPNPPVPKAGEPAPRPTDPDATGGFYQPLRLAANEPSGPEYSVGLTRISCGIARVSAEQVTDYQNRYRPNENPALLGVVVGPGREDAPLTADEATTATVKAGSHVTFRASWFDCPTTPECGNTFCEANEDRESCPEDCKDNPHGCSGSEPYIAFDLGLRQLVARREGMRVSWYGTGGSFDHDRSGRAESGASVPFSDNTWVAPSHAGNVRLWAVLRDDRGGVDYASYFVRVE